MTKTANTNDSDDAAANPPDNDASGGTDPSDSGTSDADTSVSTTDQPLGPAGTKALKAERAENKALKQQIADMKPLLDIAERLRTAVTPEAEKSDFDRLTEQISVLTETAESERAQRLRLEVATEKGLTPAQAARLQGTTKGELAADADDLLALFPPATDDTAPGQRPGVRGDPAQGPRPGGTTGGLQSGAAKYTARKKNGPTFQ